MTESEQDEPSVVDVPPSEGEPEEPPTVGVPLGEDKRGERSLLSFLLGEGEWGEPSVVDVPPSEGEPEEPPAVGVPLGEDKRGERSAFSFLWGEGDAGEPSVVNVPPSEGEPEEPPTVGGPLGEGEWGERSAFSFLWGEGDAGEPSVVSLPIPQSGTGGRARNRARLRRQRRKQEAWFVAAVAVLAAAIPVLGYVGFRKVFNTTEGRRVDAQNDPTKTNFEANVVPTPVMLLAQGDSDDLESLTMLALGGSNAGGSVVFIPVDTTTAPLPPDPAITTTTTARTSTTKPGDTTSITLADGLAKHDAVQDLQQLTANVMGLSFETSLLMGDDQLAQYVAPVAPLTIDNPDRLVEVDSSGRSTVAFAAGSIELKAADVPRYLALRNPGESDLARLVRQQLVWQAWLTAVGSSNNPNAIPGETSTGLGKYLRGLSRGQVQYATMPGSVQGNGYTPDRARIDALMTTFVPLPTPANPGDRVRIRLLSGVGPVDTDALLSTRLVPPNAQIVIVGNADGFDYTTTRIVYYDDRFAPAATSIQQLLGVGEISKNSSISDAEDVTIIIGEDLVNKQGLRITTSSDGG